MNFSTFFITLKKGVLVQPKANFRNQVHMHLKIVSYYKQVQANLFDLMCTKMKTSNYLIVRLSMIFPTLSSMLLAFLIDLKSPSLLALRVNASKMSCHEGSLVAILFLGTTLPEIPQVTQM